MKSKMCSVKENSFFSGSEFYDTLKYVLCLKFCELVGNQKCINIVV